MRLELTATGPASREVMWEAYADPGRWSAWAPQIRRVEAEGRLREGLEGTVVAALGVRARFLVVSVDPDAGRWSWAIEVGPIRLGLAHEVADGRAALTIDGPAPAVLAYAPVARVALSRLVRLGR